jgi:hypothetical protein
MNNQTALQITDFNFYGDNLIALKDNATGEIYTAISHVLRGIGFNPKQVEHQQNKILKDELLKSHTLKFSGVDLNMPSVNEIWCISQRKLPIALAKINITPKMKKEQPELSEKLLTYQDKCADVLASVFIDHKTVSDINIQPITEALTSITNTLTALAQTMTSMQQEINAIKDSQENKPKLPKKKWSYWSTKMYPKYQLLTDYFHITHKELYKNLYRELQNTYPDIDLNQEIDDYCYENNLELAYTLDVIEHNLTLRKLFESIVDNLLEKYNLADTYNTNTRIPTVFDEAS